MGLANVKSANLLIGGQQNGTWTNKTWISITYRAFFGHYLYLKSFISKLHEIYIIASQKFEEFGNECPYCIPKQSKF